MIDKNGGLAEINFREIARQLGCAHTSIYNYYTNYQELLSAAMKLQIIKKREEIIRKIRENKKNNVVIDYLSALFEYICEHKGLYKFLWIDDIGKDMEELLGSSLKPEKIFIQEIQVLSKNALSTEEAERTSNIIYSYFHGEVVKYLCGRKKYEDELDFKRYIFDNIFMIAPFIKVS